MAALGVARRRSDRVRIRAGSQADAGLASVLLGLAVAAASLPARRAIALSPIASLRE
jgi:hypothetical protein